MEQTCPKSLANPESWSFWHKFKISSSSKICDILNSGRLWESEIFDSVSQIWDIFWNIEIILNFLACQKPGIRLTIEMAF